jgi:hypothetical protein
MYGDPNDRAAMVAQLRRAAALLESQAVSATANQPAVWLGETPAEPGKYFPEFNAKAGGGA